MSRALWRHRRTRGPVRFKCLISQAKLGCRRQRNTRRRGRTPPRSGPEIGESAGGVKELGRCPRICIINFEINSCSGCACPLTCLSRLKLGWLALILAAVVSPAISRALASDSGVVAKPRMADRGGTAVPATQPMVVVRMRAKDRCEPRCPEWIMAEGTITPDTPGRFRQLLRQIGSEKLPVVLDSSGGDLDAALEIGRIIRANGLTTIIGRSEVQGCAPRELVCNEGRRLGLAYAGFVSIPGACSGACLLLHAAGVQRIGLQRPACCCMRRVCSASATGSPRRIFPTLSRSAQGKPEQMRRSWSAPISPTWAFHRELIPRLRRNGLTLSRADMLHFGLSTGRQRVEDFTGSSICARPTPAANCVAAATAQPSTRVSTRPDAKRKAAPRSSGVIMWKDGCPWSNRVIIWGGIEEM